MSNQNNIFKRLGNFVSTHKIGSALCGVVLVGVLSVGIVSNGNYAKKIANSQMALEIAEKNGVIATDTLKVLEQNGGFAEFGTEIINPETGETVVLTKNEDGSITKTITRDASGNKIDNSSSTEGHSHVFVPHYGTRTIQTGTTYVVDVPAQAAVTEKASVKPAGTYCDVCGANITGHETEHANETSHEGSHIEEAQYEDVQVSEAVAEQGHYEPVYGQESYIDYYYTP